MPLDVLSATASMGVFSLTALLSGAFLVHEVLHVADRTRFSILLALYLGTGLTFNALVSVLAGLFFISPLVPILVSAALGLRVAYRKRADLNANGVRAAIERAKEDLPGLLVLLLSFTYFAVVSGLMQWPPPGDVATAHGPMVTLFLADGRIPLNEQGYAILYPPGLQALAAFLGPVFLRYGGEMVYSLGAVLAALLAPLVYGITYTWTGQWRWAAVAAVVPFIPHVFNDLEQWTVGYFFNGPYPNLFGFDILLTLVAALIVEQRASEPTGAVRRLALGALVTLACLFIYPSFAILSVLILGTWVVLHRGAIWSELTAALRPTKRKVSLAAAAAVLALASVGYLALLVQVGQDPRVMVDYLVGRYMPGGGGAAATPLPYAVPPTFFVDDVSGWISLVAMVAAAYRIRRHRADFFDWSYLLLGLALFVSLTGPGFSVLWIILPSRSSPLFVLLAWPALFRTVEDLAAPGADTTERAASHARRSLGPLPRGNAAPLLVAAVVVLTPVAVQPAVLGAMANPVAAYGKFWPQPSFSQDFQTLEWIAEHVNHSALLANDGSYLSRYLPAVTVQNMSNSNWEEARYPQRGWDLHLLWDEPRNLTYLSQMIQRYDVRYIYASSEGGTVYPPVSFTYASKMYPPRLADAIFDHYGFLTTIYAAGLNRVYEVHGVPSLATSQVIGNATSQGFWDIIGVSGAGSIGFPFVRKDGTVVVNSGGFGSWDVRHDFRSPEDWTNSSYLSIEISSSKSMGLTLSVFDASGRSNSWGIVTLSGQVTRFDLPLAFPDFGPRVVDLGSVAGFSVANGTAGAPPRPGDTISVGAVFLSG